MIKLSRGSSWVKLMERMGKFEEGRIDEIMEDVTKDVVEWVRKERENGKRTKSKANH